MSRRGIKDIVIRSYDKYTQISSDNTVQVTTTSNVFSDILSKIAILKEQEDLTNSPLLDQKEIKANNVEEIPPKKDESAGNESIINEIELQKTSSDFLFQQLLPNILLLQQGGVGDSNQIMQNIFMLTNTFMNNNQSILKNNKILADLSINRIEAPNKLTKNDNIDNKIVDVSDSSKNNNNNKSKKSPNKKRK